MRGLLLIVLLMSACESKPLKHVDSGAPGQVSAQLIAVVEGIRVYRLYDGLHTVYITDSRHGTLTQWYERQGKSEVLVESLGAPQ